MDKKYEFTDTTISIEGHKLRQIKATKDIVYTYPDGTHLEITAGQLGGFLENEHNLTHTGASWVKKGVAVFGNANVGGNALIHGCSLIKDATIYGDSIIESSVAIGWHTLFNSSGWNPGMVIRDSQIKNTILDSRKKYTSDPSIVTIDNSEIFGLNFSSQKGKLFCVKDTKLEVYDCSFDASYRIINEMTPDSIILIKGVWGGGD